MQLDDINPIYNTSRTRSYTMGAPLTFCPSRTKRMRTLRILASAAVLSACSVAPPDAESVASADEPLYYASDKIWPTNLIDVCWESDTDATARGWVQDQVTTTWENNTGLQFTGWGICPSSSSGIRIRVADEWPHTTRLGTGIRGVAGGMVLNFVFTFKDNKGNQPFGSCIADSSRKGCIQKIAAHEFGHALGYAHEQNRGDTPTTCTELPQGDNGDTTYGAWDINSIMNYCNPAWNNGGLLSATDLAGTKSLYGLHPYRPNYVLADYGQSAGGWRTDKHVRLVGDVDGDGRSDIVGFGDAGVYVSYSTGSGFTAPSFVIGDFGYNQGWRVDQHVRLLGDLNADGRADIVGFGNDGVWVAYSTGRGFTAPAFVAANLGYNQGWRVDQHPRMLGDLNHDGRQDIVAFGNDGIWIAYSTGTGFTSPVFAVANLGYNQGWRVDQHPRYVADVNGDGRADVVGFGNDGVWVSLANASGLTPAAFWLQAFAPNAGGWQAALHPRLLADVNGDGRADIVGFGNDGVWVSLATGTGFSGAQFWVADFGYNQSWRIDKHPRFVTDVTGDGRADIVGFGDHGLMVSTSTGGSFTLPEFRIRNFGYEAGGWRINANPILLGDVAKDGRPDVIGFGNDGVWLTMQ